ncbi:MAG: hypothetical protein AAFV45_01835 [Pseudomonadota bacterium]
MSLQPPADIQVVKREDKTARLTEFMEKGLTALTIKRDEGCSSYDVSVFARSVESPVIQALGVVAADLTAAGARIRLVLTGLEIEDIDTAPVTATLAGARIDVRVTNDPRLLDAHEQLCLGTDATWIGDCLRREPAKRDAYERFSTGCAGTSKSAQTAFEHVWSRSVAMTLPGIDASAAGLNVPDLSINTAGIEGEFGGATAATRH